MRVKRLNEDSYQDVAQVSESVCTSFMVSEQGKVYFVQYDAKTGVWRHRTVA